MAHTLKLIMCIMLILLNDFNDCIVTAPSADRSKQSNFLDGATIVQKSDILP